MGIMTVPAWIEATLKADADLDDLLDGRIYEERAPRGAEYPFIAYQQVTPEEPLTTAGLDVVWMAAVWQIAVYTREASYSSAAGIAGRVIALFHAAHDQVDEDGVMLSCQLVGLTRVAPLEPDASYRQVVIEFDFLRK